MAKQATKGTGIAPPGEYTVVLEQAGDKKILVIKVVRALTGLGLKEAKDIVDHAPQAVVATTGDYVGEAIRQLEAAGGTASSTRGGAPIVVPTAADGATVHLGRCPHCRALTSGTRCENCGAPL